MGSMETAGFATSTVRHDANDCNVLELRQYTLHPGMRDTLIDLFDREFVETQEAVGIRVFGQFRDIGDPNRFVWLRGYRDMPARAAALATFYGGPVWKAHRDEANATIADSENVLLLRPARADAKFELEQSLRRPPNGSERANGFFTIAIYDVDPAGVSNFVAFFGDSVKPLLTSEGASIRGYFVTERSANNFPAHPLREGESVCVVVSQFADERAHEDHLASLSRSAQWRNEISTELERWLRKPAELLRLLPTARSNMRG